MLRGRRLSPSGSSIALRECNGVGWVCAGGEVVSGERDVVLSGAVAPLYGLSGVVAFVFKGEAKLRAVGGDFAFFDHEV